jgi:predicted metal-dependent hydrolase
MMRSKIMPIILNIVKVSDRDLEYILRVSNKAKRASITINSAKQIILTKPKRVSQESAINFLISKSDWVFQKLEKFENSANLLNTKNTKEEYLENKENALSLAKSRIEHFNNIYNFKYSKITIKNQKTRWGSCSRRGNLNFNYKIALLPAHISDYIIVHELCHLKEFNHSQRFWDLVAITIPDYLVIRKELKGEVV